MLPQSVKKDVAQKKATKYNQANEMARTCKVKYPFGGKWMRATLAVGGRYI